MAQGGRWGMVVVMVVEVSWEWGWMDGSWGIEGEEDGPMVRDVPLIFQR